MRVNKIIRKRIRRSGDGSNLAGDVNAAVSANINERGSSKTRVSSRQRIVQRSGKREVSEHEE